MTRPGTIDSGARGGFALPVVLVTLAILTMIFLTIVLAIDDSATQILSRQHQAEFELRALSAEAEFSYFATTEPLGQWSIKIGGQRAISIDVPADQEQASNFAVQDLKIDGSPYRWEELGLSLSRPIMLTVQDEAGLFNLSFASQDSLERLYLAAGYDEEKASKTVSQTIDFMDADDLITLNGAEAAEYQRLGFAPPPNTKLKSPNQLLGLLNMRQNPPKRWQQMQHLLTAQTDNDSQNINTAPAVVLEWWFGLTPEVAKAAIEARQSAPLSSLSQIGVPYDDERSHTAPNGRFRFAAVDPVQGFRYSSRLALSPQSTDRPIWVEEPSLGGTTKVLDDSAFRLPAFPKLPRLSE